MVLPIFQFDHFVKFVKDKPVAVDGNVAAIIQSSRIKDAFEIHEVKPGVTLIKVSKYSST